MAEFDIVSKYLVQHYPGDFARFTLGRDDVEGAEVIDPEQLTVEARQTDSLLRVQLGNEAVLVHTEFQAADSTQPPMARQMDCLAGMSLLSGLVYGRETVSAIFLKEGLMDIIRESPVAQYLTQQGIEQGIEQGGRERAIEALLDVLEIRFALDAAEPLAARVRGMEDLQRLKHLHRAAIQVESLKAFQALLDADE